MLLVGQKADQGMLEEVTQLVRQICLFLEMSDLSKVAHALLTSSLAPLNIYLEDGPSQIGIARTLLHSFFIVPSRPVLEN